MKAHHDNVFTVYNEMKHESNRVTFVKAEFIAFKRLYLKLSYLFHFCIQNVLYGNMILIS